MELYTFDQSFVKQHVIEGYTSVIWTERYWVPGEVELTTPVNSEAAQRLREGYFLGLEGTDEVMLLESFSVEDDQLKVGGPNLTGFLENRPYRASGGQALQQGAFLDDGTPGLLLDFAALRSVGDSSWLAGVERLGYTKNQLTNLTFPRYEASIGNGDYLREHGDETGLWQEDVPVTFGQLLDVLTQIATTFQVGFGLYLADFDESSYALEFRSYVGKNLTSDQTVYPVVQFSSAMDTLKGIKEVRSIAGYKNVAYVFSTSAMAGAIVDPGVAYADASAEDSIDFNRRALLAYNSDIKYDGDDTEENYNTYIKPALDKIAQDLLANNNYIRMVDGEIVPQTGCIYGVNYTLGDVVELLGYDGAKQKARITEYIRSKDKTGERAYPTVSLVE